MLRTPRMVLPAAAVALGAVVVLVAASTATGRSQATAPKNTTEPSHHLRVSDQGSAPR